MIDEDAATGDKPNDGPSEPDDAVDMREHACIVAGIMKTVSTFDRAPEEHNKPQQVDDHHHSDAPLPDLPQREVLDNAGDLLRALAAPVRIAIVLQLRESSRCVHELVDALGVPQPLVSQHLRILKAAGVVAGERSGREVLYRLVDHHLAHIVVAAVTHAAEDT
jgi:ArsR family transcriptional regulator, zinc-responsive transcriptional repressor